MRDRVLLLLVSLLLLCGGAGCTKIKQRPKDPQLDRLVSMPLPRIAAPGQGGPACDGERAPWSAALLVLEEISGGRTLRVGLSLERVSLGDGTERLSVRAARLHTLPDTVPWRSRIEEELEGWSIRVRRPEERSKPLQLRLEVPTAPEVELFARQLASALAGAELTWAWCRSAAGAKDADWQAEVIAGLSPEPVSLRMAKGDGVLRVTGPAAMSFRVRAGKLGGATLDAAKNEPRYNLLLVPAAAKKAEGASRGSLGYPGRTRNPQPGLESSA